MKAANDNQPGPNTPLRLADALKYAFPHGGMTVSGLRIEAGRGRLNIERIAGKDFTTLSEIENMRRLCHVKVEDRTSTSAKSVVLRMVESRNTPTGSSETEKTSPAQDAFKARLNARKLA